MDLLHALLGYVTAAVVVAGMAWSLILGTRHREPDAWFDRFSLLTLAIVVVEVVSGAMWQSTGGDPAPAHALAAGVSVVAIPVVRGYGALLRREGGLGPRAPWWWFATYAVVGVALIGLYATG